MDRRITLELRPPPTVRERILVVDDEEQARGLLVRILEREGYRTTAVEDAQQAYDRIDGAPFDLIVCDVDLPEESGLALVEKALARDEQLSALMVSGLDEVSLAERALAAGAVGYVVKPFSPNELLIGVLGALRQRRGRLDAIEELKATRQETIQRLCTAVEARDPTAAPHIHNVSAYSWRIARDLGLDREQCDVIRVASAMHDVGKIGIAEAILLKPGPLTPSERLEMQRHAEIGYRVLAGSSARLLQVAATIAWTHHEKFDGSGYPRGLAGDRIPLEGRIAAVADVFDALTRDRVYRSRLPREQALQIMHEGRGTHFDPVVLDLFMLSVQQRTSGESAPST
jgi:putative two-component system response regulator